MKKKEKIQSLKFEDRFKLTERDLKKTLNIALSRGGDFAEIFLEYSIYHLVNMEEDIIKETDESIRLGLGIRVLSGEKAGYGYTNDLSFEKIKKAAQTAAAIAAESFLRNAKRFLPQSVPQNYYPILIPAHSARLDTKISLVKSVYSSAQKYDSRIKKIKVSL
ncbi:MAG: DNA gyrase modulator, partial [Acidobacteriota bacterium]|nr:DNA gyrase modulator [Acidobacteriota bacterium]